MIILGFETSHAKCSVAISDGDKVIATAITRKPSMQAEKLVELIEQALDQANMKYSDIEYLAVTNGPGSFTGIRIGLAAASGILLVSKIKPIVLTNFDTIYWRIKHQVKHFGYAVVLIDAYRNQTYVQTYGPNNVIHKVAEMLDNNDLGGYLSRLEGKIVIAGSGLQNAAPAIQDKCITLPRFPIPDARSVCRAAYDKLVNNIEFFDVIEPLYIRQPDAKVASKSFASMT